MTVHHGGMRYPAKVLINRATTGFLRWWMFPNAIIGQPLPTVSTIDSSDLAPEKGGLQEGWHGVLVLTHEASSIAQEMHLPLIDVTKGQSLCRILSLRLACFFAHQRDTDAWMGVLVRKLVLGSVSNE